MHIPRPAASISVLLAVSSLFACGPRPGEGPDGSRTATIIVVDTDPVGLRDQIEELAVTLTRVGDSEPSFTSRYRRGELTWPERENVVPRDLDAPGRFEYAVVARDREGAVLAEARVVTGFVPGEVAYVYLELSADCARCDGAFVCGDAACACTVPVAQGSPSEFEACDAVDAGPIDAGRFDAGSPVDDAGRHDGGPDATIEDAGADAGIGDAGPPPRVGGAIFAWDFQRPTPAGTEAPRCGEPSFALDFEASPTPPASAEWAATGDGLTLEGSFAELDGAYSEYLEALSGTNGREDTDAFSVEVWVSFEQLTERVMLVSEASMESTRQGNFFMSLEPTTGPPAFVVSVGLWNYCKQHGAGQIELRGAFEPTAHSLHQVVFTHAPAGAPGTVNEHLYFDGLEENAPYDGPGGGVCTQDPYIGVDPEPGERFGVHAQFTNAQLRVGGTPLTSGVADSPRVTFHGLAIYDVALGSDEVRQNWLAGASVCD